MRKMMYSLLVATVSLSLTAGLARAQERRQDRGSRAEQRDELESRAHTVNALADKRGGMKEAMHDVSVETGVPTDQIEHMRDQHPDAGAAGIMIACVIADNAKGSPETYLTRHVNGKGWGAIARDNNVPLDKINSRLDKLQRYLEGTPSSDRNLPATGRDRSRSRDY
jgi:hypothetical protein